MSHGTQDEYYDYPYDFDDAFDDHNDPDDSHECPDDTDEDNGYPEDHNVECEDDDYDREDSCNPYPVDHKGKCANADEYGEEDSYNDDHLYQCKARFKGHTEYLEIFSCEYDIAEHLRYTHKTQKWLVNTYVRIT